MINLPSVCFVSLSSFTSHFRFSLLGLTISCHSPHLDRIWNWNTSHKSRHTHKRLEILNCRKHGPAADIRSHSKLPPFKSTIGHRKSFTRRLHHWMALAYSLQLNWTERRLCQLVCECVYSCGCGLRPNYSSPKIHIIFYWAHKFQFGGDDAIRVCVLCFRLSRRRAYILCLR